MRQAIDLRHAYRLLNHGPTVLVSACHEGRANLMPAAWVMPLDFHPPRVAVVIDKAAYTRQLIEASGRLALSVPCAAQAALVHRLGGYSGATRDKFTPPEGACALDEPQAASPLVAGCVAWLDARLLREPHVEQSYDLFLAEVTAAWADARVFHQGRWTFDQAGDALRTLHHVAGGHFLTPGRALDAGSGEG
ncbi:flavin reductase family protein [Ideonella livida]|uniref:Flavin reductase family protein n=1 Tax=Ideonella livida TaxID=2707176 RepID=A0A7C9TJ00_9BURK|nr:flavin reductase family protein [Ideonella livida]NDY91681.1 flavin reductase family protein [Ideonella livida]